MFSIFNDFKLEKKVSNETIEKYKNKVPKKINRSMAKIWLWKFIKWLLKNS